MYVYICAVLHFSLSILVCGILPLALCPWLQIGYIVSCAWLLFFTFQWSLAFLQQFLHFYNGILWVAFREWRFVSGIAHITFVSKTYASNFVHSNLFVLFCRYLWIILDLQHFWQQHSRPAAYWPSGFLAERILPKWLFVSWLQKKMYVFETNGTRKLTNSSFSFSPFVLFCIASLATFSGIKLQ